MTRIMETFILILMILAIVSMLIIIAVKESDKARDERIKKAAAERKAKLEQENLVKEFANKVKTLKQKYGDATIEIQLSSYSTEKYNLSTYIYIFEEAQIAYIAEEAIPFSKIRNCTLTDNKQTIIKTISDGSVKTSAASMLGRALVGGVLLGGVGALTGAATAKKNTDTKSMSSSTSSHYFTIFLQIDDIANPQRILKFGSNEEDAYKTASVFDIIISRNNQ